MSVPAKALNHGPADILRYAMIAMGLGVLPGTKDGNGNLVDWPISAEGEPPSPDNVITVRDTTPMLDGRSPDGEEAMHWGIQITVRGQTSQNFTMPRAELVRTRLSNEVNGMVVTVANLPPLTGSVQYVIGNVSKLRPLYKGREAPNSKRGIWTLNGFLVVRML